MKPVRSCFLILFLKEFRVGKSLVLLLSFDHKNGPKYLDFLFKCPNFHDEHYRIMEFQNHCFLANICCP